MRRPTLMHRVYSALRPSGAAATQGKRDRNRYYQRKSNGPANKAVQRVMQFAHDVDTLPFSLTFHGVIALEVRIEDSS